MNMEQLAEQQSSWLSHGAFVPTQLGSRISVAATDSGAAKPADASALPESRPRKAPAMIPSHTPGSEASSSCEGMSSQPMASW
jgi:hypothetical protein